MIIGLTGYARSGKDEVAKILVERFGYQRLAFADQIKDILMLVNPILESGHRLNELVTEYGWEVAKAKTEVRRLLQTLGMAVREILDNEVWIVAVMQRMDEDVDYVIPDVRFYNEAANIKLMGGEIWRINRPDVTAINDHISESEMDSYTVDRVLENDGTLEDLELSVKTRMATLLE